MLEFRKDINKTSDKFINPSKFFKCKVIMVKILL